MSELPLYVGERGEKKKLSETSCISAHCCHLVVTAQVSAASGFVLTHRGFRTKQQGSEMIKYYRYFFLMNVRMNAKFLINAETEMECNGLKLWIRNGEDTKSSEVG